jgi:membrane fusion protein (multidrug efflux system)
VGDRIVNENQTQAARGRSGRRKLLAIPALIIIAAGALMFWLMGRGWVSTDDAQIQGNLVPISPRVAGYVDRIYVDDNQPVAQGQILVQLDTRDLQTRLHAAEAALAAATAQAAAAGTQVSLIRRTSTAGQEQAGASVAAAGAGVQATRSQIAAADAQVAAAQANAAAARDMVTSAQSDVEAATAQIEAARAAVDTAQANVSSAQAQAVRVAADAARYEQLYGGGAISKQQMDAADAANVSAQAALDAARQGVKSATAALAQAKARKAAADAGLRQATARAVAAQAAADQARAAATAAHTGLAEARARLAGARAGEAGASTAPQQIAISTAQDRAAAARIKQAQADIRAMRLQLSYTKITAPVAGVVSQKTIEPGQFVQPGQLLMSVVPLSNVWAVANFKETEIGHMRAGQRAIVAVDTYPGRKFYGRVDSIGAATGAKFSLLPAENATGNFVKVVQRVPVKIVFDQPLPKGVVLRPGINVVARVDVRGA